VVVVVSAMQGEERNAVATDLARHWRSDFEVREMRILVDDAVAAAVDHLAQQFATHY
jgi:hypothetical protein